MNFQRNRRIVPSLGVLILLCLVGCNSDKNGSAPPAPITAITISSSTTSLAMGQTLKVSALGVTASGIVGEVTPVSWNSDDPSVATVSPEGVVLGKSMGVTSVSASFGGLYTTTEVGVVSSNQGATNLSVSGFAFYEDQPYTDRGFTGQTLKTPIRQAVINLIALDGLTTLTSTTTQSDGSYQFGPINNSGRRGGVYLQILAKTSVVGQNPMVVMDNATHKSVLALRGAPLDDSTTNSFSQQEIVAPASSMGGAFNILDTFLKGGEFIQNTGCPPPTPCKPLPLLTAYWTRGTQTNTFYESPPVNAISINGGQRINGSVTGDTDEYDDAILAHEYGHFMAATFSRDDSRGGPHTFGESTQDIRLAWSEGWATFFATASLGNPLYVDTQGRGVFAFNMETLGNRLTTNEAAIARVLWDIFDAPPQDPDNDPMMTTGFGPIWKTVIAMNDPATPATIESFVLKFQEQNPASSASLQNILTGAGIELFPDPAETNTETSLLLNTPQHHTLHATGPDPFSDIDRIPFSVIANQLYTLETSNLTNGADTFLTLENSSGSARIQNDNTDGKSYPLECNTSCPRNDQTTLASFLSFTAGTTGTLFVRVQRSPAAPLSTGRAGSYDIQLTSPSP